MGVWMSTGMRPYFWGPYRQTHFCWYTRIWTLCFEPIHPLTVMISTIGIVIHIDTIALKPEPYGSSPVFQKVIIQIQPTLSILYRLLQNRWVWKFHPNIRAQKHDSKLLPGYPKMTLCRGKIHLYFEVCYLDARISRKQMKNLACLGWKLCRGAKKKYGLNVWETFGPSLSTPPPALAREGVCFYHLI